MTDEITPETTLQPSYVEAAAVRRPKRWSGVIAAATVLMLGGSMDAAAKAANVAPKTLRRWRRADWWQDVEREANAGFLDEARGICRDRVKDLITRGDPKTVRWAAERLVEEFAPPKQKVDVGGQLEHVVDYRDRLAARLATRLPAEPAG